MRACVRAERLGGENAKLLALWHVGMLRLKRANAGMRDGANAKLLAAHHAGMLCEGMREGRCTISTFRGVANVVQERLLRSIRVSS